MEQGQPTRCRHHLGWLFDGLALIDSSLVAVRPPHRQHVHGSPPDEAREGITSHHSLTISAGRQIKHREPTWITHQDAGSVGAQPRSSADRQRGSRAVAHVNAIAVDADRAVGSDVDSRNHPSTTGAECLIRQCEIDAIENAAGSNVTPCLLTTDPEGVFACSSADLGNAQGMSHLLSGHDVPARGPCDMLAQTNGIDYQRSRHFVDQLFDGKTGLWATKPTH